MKSYECIICKEIFYSYKEQKGRIPKYCSRKCCGLDKKDEISLSKLALARSLIIRKPKKEKEKKQEKVILRFFCHTCMVEFFPKDKKNNPKYCSRYCFQNRVKSSETIKKMSDAKKGKDPWNKGKKMWDTRPHPKGTLGKPSKLKGRKLPEEHRIKLCFSKKRSIKRKINFQCEICEKSFTSKASYKSYVPKFCSSECFGKSIRKEKNCPICGKHVSWINNIFCSIKCRSVSRTGIKLSEESKKKMSISRKGNPLACGENHYFWKGGITPINEKIRKSTDYSKWRKSVFERDDYTCQFCKKRGGVLHADHIQPFSTHPELRMEISNGRTLCMECHRKTDTYGSRVYLKKIC